MIKPVKDHQKMKAVAKKDITPILTPGSILTDLMLKKMNLIRMVIMCKEWWTQTQMTAKLLKMRNKKLKWRPL
jgi:DNA mismatch repair ATPase MutS